MKYFEYKTIVIPSKGMFSSKRVDTYKIDKVLNDLGKEGWELVTAIQTTAACSGVDGLLCTLKRCSYTKYTIKHQKLVLAGNPNN